MSLGSVVPCGGQRLSGRGIKRGLFPVLLAALFPACGDPVASDDTGLLLVRAVRQVPPSPSRADALCQVEMDVEVVVPDCTAFGRVENVREGNVFRMELHGSRGRCHGHGSAITSLGVCMPGIPPPLPSGQYFLDVNFVRGTFTIP